MLGALLAAAALASLGAFFWRFDLSLYDAALPVGPAPSDVVIVAVDDASIAELGGGRCAGPDNRDCWGGCARWVRRRSRSIFC